MGDFLDINSDWFSDKYLPILGRRFWSFKIALNLFLQLGGDTIVETGCIRVLEDWLAGYSTYIFSDFSDRYPVNFYSIDNSKENLNFAKRVCAQFRGKTRYILGDSVEVLKKWDTPINLLYLDSVDCDPKDEEVSKKAQEHQLAEVKAAYSSLTKNGIVLLDDNYFKNGGKTRLTKEFLSEKKWVNIMDFEQSLWVRTG